MSEFTPPSSSEYRTPRDGLGVLKAALTALSRRVKALEGSAPLRTAGIFITDTVMRVTRSLLVEGDFASTGDADITGTTHIGGATDIDGTLNVDATTTLGGDTTISGNTDITGELDVTGDTTLGGAVEVSGVMTLLSNMIVNGLIRSQNFVAGVSGWRLTSTGLEVNTLTAKDAIIGNDALTSPTTPRVGSGTTGVGVALGTGVADYAAANLTVPAGYTSAQVTGISSAYIGGDGVEIRTAIGATSGDFMNVIPTTSPGLANGSSGHAAILTGLTGGATIAVRTQARRLGAPASTAYLTTVASAVFYR